MNSRQGRENCAPAHTCFSVARVSDVSDRRDISNARSWFISFALPISISSSTVTGLCTKKHIHSSSAAIELSYRRVYSRWSLGLKSKAEGWGMG